MEQRQARNQLQRGLTLGCVLSGLVASAGCWQPTQHTATPVPAARQHGEGRPFQFQPPLALTSPDDAVVRIVSNGSVTCTGTLIADDRVLTAHHCVAEHDARGRVQTRDIAPDGIQIELGGGDWPWGEVGVRAIVAPQCGFEWGDGDIAILVLERHLIGMSTYTVSLEAAPQDKDEIKVFGFGRCALSPDAIHLRRGDGVIGSIAPGQFRAPASICPGDSGGPVKSSKDQIIGVISASVMDGDDRTKGASVFTRIDAWRQLFAAAEEISLGASPSELPPYGDCHAPLPRPPAR